MDGAKDQSHKKTMTHNKKCTRTFHTKLDNKLRSFRAMKVNWFCQKQGFHFIICLLLRTLKDFRMNDCVLTHFHVTIWIQFAIFSITKECLLIRKYHIKNKVDLLCKVFEIYLNCQNIPVFYNL